MPDETCGWSPDVPEGESPPLPGGLVLVSTPIGNLADLTIRARDTLRAADLILCEDTRHTSRLLSAHDIKASLRPLHDHNEEAQIEPVLRLLRAGKCIALVSDAGTPLVSDPGYRLVRAAIAEGIAVTATPGANAATTALVLSGLPPLPCLFLGFPPPRQAARRASFAPLLAAERAGLSATLIWHEAPHRLAGTLADMAEIFGDRPAVVARELTKRFEEVRRGGLATLAAHYAAEEARGEITLVVGPAVEREPDAGDLDADLLKALKSNSLKDAASVVAAATGLPRKMVYARALVLSRDQEP